MSQYVLCKSYPNSPHGTMFVCGDNPSAPLFNNDLQAATRLSSVEEALTFRDGMPHQLGGTHAYKVYEVRPDGTLVPLGK